MTDAAKNWFEVDRKGLSKLIERRGKVWVIHELISNAWDADGTTRVDVSFTPEEGVPKVWVTITDDAPAGFAALPHAWTLFAESSRKGDATKRGRFNLGEKLVLALCDEASIVSTSGGVMFDNRGRTNMREKRERGSEFSGLARMTRAELAQIKLALKQLIPPAGIDTYIDGEKLATRTPIKQIEATLPTEIADEEGMLRRSSRKCTVNVYEPLEGEDAMLYELGVPVVEMPGDRWHVSIEQKVPLNTDRDNVTPAYLRAIRTLVVNTLSDKLTSEEANATFVNEALADDNVAPEAVSKALDIKYGTKRAIWDPSDLEANNTLISQGFTLIHGNQLTKAQWRNVRTHDTKTVPAGRIAPTSKAIFSATGEDVWVSRDKWTPGMCRVVDFSFEVAAALLGREITVAILSDIRLNYLACFGNMGGGEQLIFNVGRLGHAFFDACAVDGPTDRLMDLLLHELAHAVESDHLNSRYHDALTSFGAKLARLALTNPGLFK
jgi:hypothetical protein